MKIREECGVVGVVTKEKGQASFIAYRVLLKLQHRGQESVGIVTFSGNDHYLHKNFGLVSQVFNEEILKRLKGRIAIGHVRYSTSGKSKEENIQPFLVNLPRYGYVALAHNGHIANSDSLRRVLEKDGVIFQSSSDTEVILHLIAKSQKTTLKERLKEALSKLEGSYSLVIGSEEGIYGIRDPYGFRPLFLGRLYDGTFIFASETCALKEYHLVDLLEIEPGEIIYINKNGEINRERF